MNRKNFLRSLGLAGIGVSSSPLLSRSFNPPTDECLLIPTETAGPFPLDLSENNFFFRQDVREDRSGVQLNLKMRVKGLENCAPMPNVRVNIWHCDKDGNYSGYNSETGLTYLRGYQVSDINGEVEFITIIPGWYPGRVCHIHFQVYVSNIYSAVSQLTFDIPTINEIYATQPEVYTKGDDPLTPATDGLFFDGYDRQIAEIMPNNDTGGYNAFLELSVQGSGVVGVSHLELETAKHVQLGQNYPNPFSEQSNIPFTLCTSANVKLSLWNLNGKKCHETDLGRLAAGKHEYLVNFKTIGIKATNYIYQLEIINSNGRYTSYKMMTRQ